MQETPFHEIGSLNFLPLETVVQTLYIQTPTEMPHHLSVAHNPGSRLDLQDDYCHCEQQREVVENACFVEQLWFP